MVSWPLLEIFVECDALIVAEASNYQRFKLQRTLVHCGGDSVRMELRTKGGPGSGELILVWLHVSLMLCQHVVKVYQSHCKRALHSGPRLTLKQ